MRLPMPSLLRLAIVLSVALATRAAWAESPAPGGAGASIRIDPKEIRIGMFYRGAKVHVEGTAPAGSRVALLCVGEEGKVELKRKGKVWGVLWMNVGEVAFEHVPSLYLARTDLVEGHPSIGSIPAGARLGLGYDGIEAQVVSSQAGESGHSLFREFIKLKEQEGLYSFERRGVRSGSAGTGSSGVSADFSLPASIPPGVYEVRMLGYQGDTGVLLASETLTVRRVGFAALIASTAQRYGLLYGALSVVVAIAAGFLTGVVFSKASKKAH